MIYDLCYLSYGYKNKVVEEIDRFKIIFIYVTLLIVFGKLLKLCENIYTVFSRHEDFL